MPRGGKREGAGRPDGTTGIKKKPKSRSRDLVIVREVVQEEMRARLDAPADVAPIVAPKAIDVMRKNMVFFDSVAEAFLDKAEKAHVQGDQAVAIDFFAENARYRLMAQKCAESVVPFEEARLSSSVPAEPPQLEDGTAARDVTPGDRLAHITKRFTEHVRPTVIEGETVKRR